ncbi:hypothetical protein GGX14DRAFT_566800 [Mycena pura]|uniref:Hydrophobin n=1 Tax=Mycena pura TaxID=153505 RepID=A0AAD6YEA7_9AGAR|nr:hypothetical protein GGX14DRAFT_566800 [Mycena pura]
MFTKVSLLVTSLLVTLAVADYPPPQPGSIDMCCDTVGGINDPAVVQTAVGAGIEILDFPGPYGIGCDAIVIFSDPWYGSADAVAARAN